MTMTLAFTHSLSTAQYIEAGFLGTAGKVAAITIGVLIGIGLVIGLILGFFVGRAVGRRR
ncbi:MAG: hypothetical protein ACRDQ5_00140 [Sciscionella sp.]